MQGILLMKWTRNLPDGAAGRNRGRQLARMEASITDPVTKMVGLILGSLEFQNNRVSGFEFRFRVC